MSRGIRSKLSKVILWSGILAAGLLAGLAGRRLWASCCTPEGCARPCATICSGLLNVETSANSTQTACSSSTPAGCGIGDDNPNPGVESPEKRHYSRGNLSEGNGWKWRIRLYCGESEETVENEEGMTQRCFYKTCQTTALSTESEIEADKTGAYTPDEQAPGTISRTSGGASYTWNNAGGSRTVTWSPGTSFSSITGPDQTTEYSNAVFDPESGALVSWDMAGGEHEEIDRSVANTKEVTRWRDDKIRQKTYVRIVVGSPYHRRVRETIVPYRLDEQEQAQPEKYLTTIRGFHTASGNRQGRLWFVVNPEGLRRYLAVVGYDKGINPNDPKAECDLDKPDVVTDEALLPYASMVYGDYDEAGRPTQVTQGCANCGGEGSYQYSFPSVSNPNQNYPPNPTREESYNVWKTWRRTVDPTGLRKVEFLNAYGRTLCTVVQEMNEGNIVNRWITHNKYDWRPGRLGNLVETRQPSACIAYSPVTGTGDDAGWTTDPGITDTGTAGLSRLYEYWCDSTNSDNPDATNGYELKSEKVRQGLSGNAYYVRRYAYTSTTYDGRTVYRMASQIDYPTACADEVPSPDDRLTTIYAYAYYQENGQDTHWVRSKTVTFPTVATGHHGPGSATTLEYHFYHDANNNLYWNDWTKNEDGSYSYTKLDTLGRTEKTIIDVDTSQESTGFADTGWAARTGTLHLVTTYAYDGADRLNWVQDPAGRKTQYAYFALKKTEGNTETTIGQVTLTAPHVDGNGHYDYGPMQLSVTDAAGRTICSAMGTAATPTDGDLSNDWDSSQWADDKLTIQAAFKLASGAILHGLTVNHYNDAGRLTSADRYHNIPTAPDGNGDYSGSAGTNYYRTAYAYGGTTGRQYKVTAPDGTVNWTEFDKLGRAASAWRGTDDTGGAVGDPSNGGANSMVKLSETYYDGATVYGALAVGDGNVTMTKQFADADTPYATKTDHDWRNRQVGSRGPDKMASKLTLDNLGRATVTESYYDSDEDFTLDSAELRAKTETRFDEKGQGYQSVVYQVKSDHTTGNTLTTDYWYDARGRQVKVRNPNGLFNKTAYDAAGRATTTYVCFQDDETDYADASAVTGDTVIEQADYAYDAGGNQLTVKTWQRHDNATCTGALTTTANARLTFSATWYDPLSRLVLTANYGAVADGDLTGAELTDYDPATQDNQSYSAASATLVPNSHDNVIVTKLEYNTAGQQYKTTDNLAKVAQRNYDALGRMTKLIENYDDGTADETDTDKDRTTEYAFDSAGRQYKIVAKNPKGSGNGVESQETYYFYKSALNGAWGTDVVYPDGVATSVSAGDLVANDADHVHYTFDRMGRKLTAKDQRGVEHTYVYDSTTGRLATDKITNLPAGVDDYVQRIEYSYLDDGRAEKITSYSDATGGSVRNEVKFTYEVSGSESWGRVTKSQQAHGGAVDANSPAVDYAFADGAASGAAKFVRPVSVTYPGPQTRRVIYYNYPSDGGVGDRVVRLDNMASTDTNPGNGDKFAAYTYLGAGTVVQVAHPAVPSWLRLTLDTGGSGTISVGDSVTDGANGTGVVMAIDSTYCWVRVTGQTSWAASGTITKDANNTKPYSAKADSDGLTLTYGSGGTYGGLDRFGRVIDQKWSKSNGPVLDQFKYAYDRMGNRLYRENGVNSAFSELNHANNPTAGTEFDGLGRLKEWRRGTLDAEKDGLTTTTRYQTFGLDSLGNWPGFNDNGTSQSRTHNASNELTAIDSVSTHLAYDAAGNMIKMPKVGDEANHHLVGVWDAWNRLTQVKTDDVTPVVIATYRYDGQRRRIVKLLGPDPDNPTERYDYYFNQDWQILEVRKGQSANPYEQYIWDVRYIDAPVCRYRDGNTDGDYNDTGDGTDDNLYFTNDANMNVTALVDAATGGVIERYVYDPYGKVTIYNPDWSNTVSWSNSKKNEILYCGYRYDLERESYNVRHRPYHLTLGRWITPDPSSLGWVSGENLTFNQPSSLFEYAGNKPAHLLDFSGLLHTHLGLTTGDGGTHGTGVSPPPVLPITFPVYEMTRAMSLTHSAINQAFTQYDNNKKCYLCWIMKFNWDINRFSPSGDLTARVIRIGGNYYTGCNVNYFLWGRISRLCSDYLGEGGPGLGKNYTSDYHTMISTMITWKTLAYWHMPQTEAVDWAIAGWQDRIAVSAITSQTTVPGGVQVMVTPDPGTSLSGGVGFTPWRFEW